MNSLSTHILKSLVLSITLFAVSCASIISKSQYPVTISSNPTGASIEVFDTEGRSIHSASTPATITLRSGRGYFKKTRYVVKATLSDGRVKETVISSSLDGWYIGNILFGGLIGMVIVDPLTGAMYKLPNSAEINFTDTAAVADGLQIVSMDTLDAELASQLVPLDS